MQETRNLNPSTIANHVGSILYALKYLHKELAPNYLGVALVAQLRRLQTELQRQGDLARPKTTHELQSIGKWLDW